MTANFKLPTLYLAILASSWRSLRFIISRPDDGLTAMFAMVFAMVAMSFLPPPGHSAEDPEALRHSERQLRISYRSSKIEARSCLPARAQAKTQAGREERNR